LTSTARLKIIKEKEEITHSAGFWNDPKMKKAEELMKEIASVKSWTTAFSAVDTAVEDMIVLYDFNKEGEASDEEVEAQFTKSLAAVERLELRNMLRREEDRSGQSSRSTPAPAAPRATTGHRCSCECTSCGARKADIRSQKHTTSPATKPA
jgi:hypothetical protein